jgi:hypothetical protein
MAALYDKTRGEYLNERSAHTGAPRPGITSGPWFWPRPDSWPPARSEGRLILLLSIHCRASTTHNLTVMSLLPEASVLPSGEKVTSQTILSCPLSVASSCLVSTQHIAEATSRIARPARKYLLRALDLFYFPQIVFPSQPALELSFGHVPSCLFEWLVLRCFFGNQAHRKPFVHPTIR